MDPVSFLIQFAISYIIGRLQQPNGPRVKDLAAGLGDYGAFIPALFGEMCRVVGVFIVQDDIKETVHKKKPPTDFLFGVVGALLPKVKTYTYSDTFALALADRTSDEPIEGVDSIVAGGKTIFRASESAVVSQTLDGQGRLVRRKYGPNAFCKSVTVYGGGIDQVSDPILNAAVGQQPGYRRTAYVVVEDLQLKPWGGATIPAPFEVLVKNKTGQRLAKIIEIVCAAAGIDPVHQMSTTAAIGLPVRGYAVIDAATCWDALKPLLSAFAVDISEVAGRLRTNLRAQGLKGTIPPEDMGAYIYGDSPPERISFKRSKDISLPRELELTFVDPDRNYQPNVATARRSEGDAKSNQSVNLPLVLTADEGAKAAEQMLWDAWLGRIMTGFSLTDAWAGFECGKPYAINVGGQIVPYRGLQKTRGANGIIEVEGVSDEDATYTSVVSGSSGTAEPPVSTVLPDTRLVVIDGPILLDEDDEYGFYVVMAGSTPAWLQGEIKASLEDDNYEAMSLVSESAPVGDVTGILAAGPTDGLDDTLDTASVLTVELLHEGMTLSSATDDELDQSENLAYVGKDGLGEYLQFKTATQVGPTTWELTDLRRGRRGTDWAITEHVADEEFALLTDGGRFRIPESTTDGWGVPIYLKGVTFNQEDADADTIVFTNTGEGKRPYSPVNVSGEWDGSNNLTISVDLRSRLNAGGLGIDDRDEIEVEVLTGAGRTIIGTGNTTDYSAADQTSDGLTPGDSVAGRVRQTSDVNNGRWRSFFLLGPGALARELEDGSTLRYLEDGANVRELE